MPTTNRESSRFGEYKTVIESEVKYPVSTLGLLGGKPIRQQPFPSHSLIGLREKRAVQEVLDSGCLSGFYRDFLGGPRVQRFEKQAANYFGVRHAIAVNSGTAALHGAIAAAGIGPGDEVIVPCYTFTATASAVLMHNAVPIFADVDPRTFCLSMDTIRVALTPRTKAIIPVHLLGNACPMDEIMAFAIQHNLKVIEDTAQAPLTRWRGRLAGTIGHAGTLSFVETKNMTTGEGGMVLTNDDEIAERCRLIRNHGESWVSGKPRAYVANILGWNYRMTEIEAAIGAVQLERLQEWNQQRIDNACYLSSAISCEGISTPFVPDGATHTYHAFGMLYDADVVGVSRALFQKALASEGIPCTLGYPHPLYRNPIFQIGSVYGEAGCPFTCSREGAAVSYGEVYLPIAEDLCRNRALWTFVVRPPARIDDMKDVVDAFEKVFEHRRDLEDYVD